MTTTGHLAVEMFIELPRIVIESDDEAVASDAVSILTLYENDQTARVRICCDVNGKPRELLLEWLRVEFLRITTMQDQITSQQKAPTMSSTIVGLLWWRIANDRIRSNVIVDLENECVIQQSRLRSK
jgi:hypothetical protein